MFLYLWETGLATFFFLTFFSNYIVFLSTCHSLHNNYNQPLCDYLLRKQRERTRFYRNEKDREQFNVEECIWLRCVVHLNLSVGITDKIKSRRSLFTTGRFERLKRQFTNDRNYIFNINVPKLAKSSQTFLWLFSIDITYAKVLCVGFT